MVKQNASTQKVTNINQFVKDEYGVLNRRHRNNTRKVI